MSLFNSQTIFSILVTLLIGAALYYYIKYKYRILELTQREQAKVLQSVIMSMNNNNHNLQEKKTEDPPKRLQRMCVFLCVVALRTSHLGVFPSIPPLSLPGLCGTYYS